MLASDTDKQWITGYVSGSFDLFHIGHLNLIRRAKERCDYLIVGVLTDELIFTRKGKWPVVPLDQRMEIVAAIKYVNEVVVTTPDIIPRHEACKKLGFDAFFTGDDWKASDAPGKDELELNKLGADLVFFPYTKEQTTTKIQELVLPPAAEHATKPKKTNDFSYLFPFDKVNRDERVIIYGAGTVGMQYIEQLRQLNYCALAAVTDSNADSVRDGLEGDGIRVIELEKLADADSYDRIVIASTKYHAEIVQRLRALGIPAEKIV